MNTIVSAFISDVNKREDRGVNKYYELGKLLLKSNIPKIIFVDSIMYNMIKDYNNENTKIFLTDIKTLYLYDYVSKLTNFNLHTDNKSKDTIKYMFMMCSKTEWVRCAINLNPFNTDYFIWLDFGLRHVFNCSDNEFIEKVNNLKYKIYDNIRIGNIWDLNINYSFNIYKDITWYFAGGVFGGNKTNLIIFADMMKEKCIDIMVNHKTIMWEVNIWYMVYNSCRNKFNPYKCNHNDSIIDNY